MTLSDFSDPEVLKTYSKSVISHPYVVFPAILDTLGNIDGARVLDIGCGSGDSTEILLSEGARVVGIDISETAVDYCRERFKGNRKVKFEHVDASRMKCYRNSTFDHAIANMVMINVEDRRTLAGIFYETKRVLRQDGKFVFTDLHPLGKMTPQTTTERQNYLGAFSYFRDGSEFESEVLMMDGSRMKFKDKHWTLETYARAMRLAGLNLHNIIEPQPVKTPDLPKIFENYPVPEYILFSCIKPGQ